MLTITLEDLQSRFLRILANQCFVRYWIHWDGVPSKRMALRCHDWEGNHVQVMGMTDAGFEIETRDGLEYYVCERQPETQLGLTQQKQSQLGVACVCEDPAETFYSGLVGVLHVAAGVIERCDACERFESDEAGRKAYAAHEEFVRNFVNQNIPVAEQHLLFAAGLRIVGVTTTDGYISHYQVKGHSPNLAAQKVSYQELVALARSRFA